MAPNCGCQQSTAKFFGPGFFRPGFAPNPAHRRNGPKRTPALTGYSPCRARQGAGQSPFGAPWGPRPVLRKCLTFIACATPLLPGAALAAAAPQARQTAPAARHPAQVRLAGDVFVERFERASGGRTARVLEHADDLHSGDRLVFVVSWSGAAPTGLTLTNPTFRSMAAAPGARWPR
eukprot:gene10367-10434_t